MYAEHPIIRGALNMADVIARDLSGDEYIVSAQSTLDQELNGNQVLQLTILNTGVNKVFINRITSMWEIEYFGDSYKVVYANKKTVGDSFFIDIRAIHRGLDALDSNRTYPRHDGYYTADRAFDVVFSGTEYIYVLMDNFGAIEIEGLGDGETKLESLKRLLERFKAEFYIVGKTFYISRYIGRDTSFEYRYKLNANNVQEELDGSATFTYVRGYGDYDESEDDIESNAKIKLEYESVLTQILGKRHAPRVAKGSYKHEDVVMKAMKETVDNSVVISVSADVIDLREQGYPYAQPEVGDRVYLVDKRIGFNEEVRVVKMQTSRFANGKVKSISVTFGNEKLGKRYASNLSSFMSKIDSLFKGEIELPFSVHDARAKEMLRKIMSVDTELTLDNGIYAIDKNNPNNVLGLNSAGWFISRDGGKTAEVIATAEGISANAITSGSITADFIKGGTFSGQSMYLDSSIIIMGVNNGIEGVFQYEDSPDSYLPRRYKGDYRINNQALWFKGDIWRNTGQFLGYNTSFFAHDAVKFRRYENQASYENNEPSKSTLDLTYQHLRFKLDGYPEIKLENTGVATIPQIVGISEIINREKDIQVNVTYGGKGSDLRVGIDDQGGFVSSNATYGRTTSGNANVYIGASGALYRSSSAMKYKRDINREAPENYRAILDLPSANWIDREEYSRNDIKQRYYGHIAEDLIEIGLPQFVEYGDDNEVESIMYERLVSPLLEVVKDHEKEIIELKAKVAELDERD